MAETTDASGPGGQGILSLLRVRGARLYFAGLTISMFGDNVLLLAAGIWVKHLTGSNSAAGLIMFFVSAPVLLGPFLGLLADRMRKRTLLIVANAAMAVVTLALVFVDGAGDVWIIYAVMLAYGTAIALTGAAESGLFVALLPERLLGAANSAVTSLQESMKIVAPAVGAALFLWLGGHRVALLDAITFALAVLALSLLRVREPAPEKLAEHHLSTKLLAGIRHILGRGDRQALRFTVLSCGVVLLVAGFTQTAIFGVIQDGLHRAPEFLGVLMSVQGVGSVVGGLIAATIMGRLGEARFVAVGIVLTAVGTGLMIIPSLAPVLAGMALRGIGLPWLLIGAFTLLQRMTPAALMGRAAAAVTMLLFAPQAVSVLVGAGLAQFLGYQVLLAVTTGVTFAAAAYQIVRARLEPGAPAPAVTEALATSAAEPHEGDAPPVR